MMKNSGNKPDSEILRQKAEELMKKNPSGSGLKLSEADNQKLIHELEVHQIELELQNEELKLAKSAARDASEKYISLYDELYDFAPSAYFTLSREGKINELNLSGANMFGKESSRLKNYPFDSFVTNDSRPTFNLFLEKVFNSGVKETCEVTLLANGKMPIYVFLTAIASPDRGHCLLNVVDIIGQTQAGAFGEMSREILQILNEPGDLHDSVKRVLTVLKSQTGFDAVGIRLQDGDDFPYFAYEGFSEDFLRTENTLAGHTFDGKICKDKDGNPCLECTCGMVITGKTDSINPLLSPGGSFWTNDSSALLLLTPEEDPRLHPRNICVHQGYATMILSPVRYNNRIVGLIHLNNKSKGNFTLATVELLEGIASQIGTALMRKRAEEALKQSEERHKGLFNSLIEGFCIIEMVFNKEDKPVDYRFLEINPAFEVQSGLRSARGKLMRELAPDLEAHWFEIYGKVALSGEPVQFENEARALNRWFEVRAFRVGGQESRKVAVCFNDITERKNAEDALKESEAKFRLLANSISQLAWMANADGYIFWYNQRWYDYTGTTPEEMEGWGWQSVHDPKTLPDVLEKWKASIAKEKQFEMVFPLLGKDGQFRSFLTRGLPLFDSEGKLTQWFGTNTDVSELHEVEKALRASEERFKSLYHGLPYSTVVFQREEDDYIIIDYNQAAMDFTKGKMGDFIGRKAKELYDAHPDIIEKFNLTYKNKTTHSLQKHYQTISTGEQIFVNLTFAYINPDRVILHTEDITEIKKAEHELTEAQEKLNLALDNGNIGIWERDLTTNKSVWDKRTEKMFGFEEGTFDGTFEAFEKCLVDEDIPHVREAIRKAVEENVPYETVYRVKLANGDINYLTVKGMVTRDEGGKALRIGGVCFDITGMKQGAEQTLFRLNEELLRSNKELEQFAYVASHDLQEPLRMVSSFTQLLGQRYKDKLDETGQQFLFFAMGGAQRCQMLINDLLKYSRIGTRGQPFSAVDMNKVLAVTIHDLTYSIRDKNAVVTFDELPVVKGDEVQLIQLMQNLVGNALKFCETQPKIHISAKEGTDRYLFSVKDNGIGIEQQYSDKIFLIFQRLFPREEYSGSGIGLAICKRIVERHGGQISFESTLGEGSTFYFTIMKEVDSSSAAIKRQNAEDAIFNRKSLLDSQLSESENQKLHHELEVYKIELDAQGEELKQAKAEAQEVSDKYIELYDFAPMAYFTLSKDSKIIELNLGGANILDKTRSHLVNSMFGFFVSKDTKPVFNQFMDNIFRSRAKETCKITIITKDNLPKDVYLVGVVTKNEKQCFVTAIDISGNNGSKSHEK